LAPWLDEGVRTYHDAATLSRGYYRIAQDVNSVADFYRTAGWSLVDDDTVGDKNVGTQTQTFMTDDSSGVNVASRIKPSKKYTLCVWGCKAGCEASRNPTQRTQSGVAHPKTNPKAFKFQS